MRAVSAWRSRIDWQVPAVRMLRPALVAVLFPLLTVSAVDAADVTGPDALRARYASRRDQLADNGFKRPLYLESRQSPGAVQGDIDALVDYPFAQFEQAVRGPAQWCDILILHLNVKSCDASSNTREGALVAYIGRKRGTSVEGAHRVDFKFAIVERTPEYLHIELTAASGPFGTRNYRIELKAAGVDSARTFVNLSYSYAYGAVAAMALRTYMTTLGAEKVGFTVVDRRPDGTPVHVGDVRGALERNAMRYFLAVDACVSTASLASEQRFTQRLEHWFDSTERYALQLHEVERSEYLDMKLNGSRKQPASQ